MRTSATTTRRKSATTNITKNDATNIMSMKMDAAIIMRAKKITMRRGVNTTIMERRLRLLRMQRE